MVIFNISGFLSKQVSETGAVTPASPPIELTLVFSESRIWHPFKQGYPTSTGGRHNLGIGGRLISGMVGAITPESSRIRIARCRSRSHRKTVGWGWPDPPFNAELLAGSCRAGTLLPARAGVQAARRFAGTRLHGAQRKRSEGSWAEAPCRALRAAP